MDICFVLTSEIDNCKIKLDRRLLQLANSLQVKIQFDGFWNMVNLSYDIKHLYKFYTEIYAEFRIEVNDKQLENRIIKIMKQIGTINVQKQNFKQV